MKVEIPTKEHTLIKHDISVPLIFRSNFCHRTAWLVHSVITDDSTLPTSQIPKAYCFKSVQYLDLSLGSQNKVRKILTCDEELNIFSYIYESDVLKKEKFVLITVLFFFELSYLFRFILDYKATYLIKNMEIFKFLIWEDLAFIFEAVSFLALVFFHFLNFRP